jgi:hypothetical protein
MSIAKAECDVKSAVAGVLACAEFPQNSVPRLGPVEARLWTALLALGRAVLALFLARCSARPRANTYVYGGQRFAWDPSNRRVVELGTRFGKLKFSRPVGLPLDGVSRTADLAVDRDLGLCSGFSLGTVMAVTRLCAMMAFATARQVFLQHHEWMPSPRATLRMVDTLGNPGAAVSTASTGTRRRRRDSGDRDRWGWGSRDQFCRTPAAMSAQTKQLSDSALSSPKAAARAAKASAHQGSEEHEFQAGCGRRRLHAQTHGSRS